MLVCDRFGRVAELTGQPRDRDALLKHLPGVGMPRTVERPLLPSWPFTRNAGAAHRRVQHAHVSPEWLVAAAILAREDECRVVGLARFAPPRTEQRCRLIGQVDGASKAALRRAHLPVSEVAPHANRSFDQVDVTPRERREFSFP